MSDSPANPNQVAVTAAVREAIVRQVATLNGTAREWLIAAGWAPPGAERQPAPEKSSPEPGVTLESAPIGTKAPCRDGGAWCKTPRGWKWNGPAGNGSTLPRPGADWDGRLLVPAGHMARHPPIEPAGKRQGKPKPQGPNQQMPQAKAVEIIRSASWARSYSVHTLDALELVREVEQYYGRTEGGPA